MGTTTFKTNAYTGCAQNGPSSYTCNRNVYTLSERTAKARMITVQEVFDFGCTGSSKSCPIWMNNYLSESTSYGGTVDDNTKDPTTGNSNQGYYTMTSISTGNPANVWYASFRGTVSNGNAYSTNYDARAVVVVSK